MDALITSINRVSQISNCTINRERADKDACCHFPTRPSERNGRMDDGQKKIDLEKKNTGNANFYMGQTKSSVRFINDFIMTKSNKQ